MYMKMEMTRNQIADLPVDKIVTVGACELQDLLSGVDPIGYNAGTTDGITMCMSSETFVF